MRPPTPRRAFRLDALQSRRTDAQPYRQVVDYNSSEDEASVVDDCLGQGSGIDIEDTPQLPDYEMYESSGMDNNNQTVRRRDHYNSQDNNSTEEDSYASLDNRNVYGKPPHRTRDKPLRPSMGKDAVRWKDGEDEHHDGTCRLISYFFHIYSTVCIGYSPRQRRSQHNEKFRSPDSIGYPDDRAPSRCGLPQLSIPTHSFNYLAHRACRSNDSNAEIEPRQPRTKLTNSAVMHGRRGDNEPNGVYLRILSTYFHTHIMFPDYPNRQFSPITPSAQRHKYTYTNQAATRDGTCTQLFRSRKSS